MLLPQKIQYPVSLIQKSRKSPLSVCVQWRFYTSHLYKLYIDPQFVMSQNEILH